MCNEYVSFKQNKIKNTLYEYLKKQNIAKNLYQLMYPLLMIDYALFLQVSIDRIHLALFPDCNAGTFCSFFLFLVAISNRFRVPWVFIIDSQILSVYILISKTDLWFPFSHWLCLDLVSRQQWPRRMSLSFLYPKRISVHLLLENLVGLAYKTNRACGFLHRKILTASWIL